MNGVKVCEQDGVVVASIKARSLTEDETTLRIGDELRAILESVSSGSRLLLDFHDVETVASTMLGDLVALNKKAERRGVILQFCRLSPDVARVISTSRLDRLFDIIQDDLPGAAS
jgi:anti-anti-sigma factor